MLHKATLTLGAYHMLSVCLSFTPYTCYFWRPSATQVFLETCSSLLQGLTNPLPDAWAASAFRGRASGFNVHNMITGKVKARSDSSFENLFVSPCLLICFMGSMVELSLFVICLSHFIFKNCMQLSHNQRLSFCVEQNTVTVSVLYVDIPHGICVMCTPIKGLIWPTLYPVNSVALKIKLLCERFLWRLRSIAAHWDHFVWRLSVCASVCKSHW